MKFDWDKKYIQIGLIAFGVVAASILFYFGIFHMDILKQGFATVYDILTPIIYAAVLSYVLWPIVAFLERKVIYPFCAMQKWNPSVKIRKIIRMFCVILALLTFFMIIYGLIAMLVPEIITSITNIIDSFPRYINNIEKWISTLFQYSPQLEQAITNIFMSGYTQITNWLTDDLLPQVNSIVINFSSSFLSVVSFLWNMVLGAMISIYLLYGKETYIAHGKQWLYCIFKPKTVNNIIRDLQFIDQTFGGFIGGKIIDSFIIGILCYIGTTILNMPYALLISVFVGVTNVIPFFGPFLGAVPCAILILLVNPIQCIYFVLFIFVLQQFDGNFLGPLILGESTGLSSFMVIVTILVGGGLFGVLGMFIGVPTCAVICTIVRNAVERRLKKKKMPTEVAAYEYVDHFDETTLDPVFKSKTKGKTDSKSVFISYRKIKEMAEEKMDHLKETKNEEKGK